MRTYTDLTEAQAVLAEHGGVLLDLGSNGMGIPGCAYWVGEFPAAVDIRDGQHTDKRDIAAYWSQLGEAGYDETKMRPVIPAPPAIK